MGKKNRKPIKPTNTTAAPVAVAPAPTTPPEPPQSLHGFFAPQDWIAAVITFLIAGFAFLHFMSPEVTLEDSGELVTGAFNFGVPHPPGYPLWARSEEHTSELQSRRDLVCRLLLEKKIRENVP